MDLIIKNNVQFGRAKASICRQLSRWPNCTLFLIFGITSPISSWSDHPTLSKLHPRSVREHFAFYELFPDTEEGKTALQHGWNLLGLSATLPPPHTDLLPLLSLVNPEVLTQDPSFSPEELSLFATIKQTLSHTQLPGHQLFKEQDILNLPSESIDLSRALLVALLGPNIHSPTLLQYEACLDLLALQIRAKLPDHPSAIDTIEAINQTLFHELNFRFPPHSLYAQDIDQYTFLPSVLQAKRGVCLGISILYLSLAQRLSLPLQVFTPPGHIFLSYLDEGTKQIRNIETTARGIHIPIEHYQGIEGTPLIPRSIKEVVGLAFMNQAAVKWQRHDFQQAIQLYEKAKPYLKGDSLLTLFLGLNHLFAKEEATARQILRPLMQDKMAYSKLLEDYFDGRVDREGLLAVFAETESTRSCILETQDNLAHILERYPYFREGLFHLALTYLQLGRSKEALATLTQYDEIDPQHISSLYYLAMLQLQHHNYPKAWGYTQRLEQLLTRPVPEIFRSLKHELSNRCPAPFIHK
jgi:tetratricopeptide (TPR) repeat protein